MQGCKPPGGRDHSDPLTAYLQWLLYVGESNQSPGSSESSLWILDGPKSWQQS